MLKNLTPAQLELVQTLLDANLSLGLTKEGFTVDGFYKSGTVTLVPMDQTPEYRDVPYSFKQGRARVRDVRKEQVEKPLFVAHSRYDGRDDVNSLSDLVSLNHLWWMRSKERFGGWSEPEEPWLSLMAEAGYVKVEEVKVKVVTSL